MSSKILLIEDEARLRQNLQLLLTSEGYTVITASNGYEGIQRLQQEQFDLVITDIMMEEGNGFEVMEYLSTHAPDTLTIVITGYASTDSAIEALRKGAYDYLAKPFDIDMMKISIERALEKVQLRRQVQTYMQELEQRVADRTRELEEMNKKLNASLADLQAAQEQLIQSEKLSALGELISGVAHELNNPLTSVLGYAELLSHSEACPPEARTMLEKISQEAMRCHQIVKNLLSFARKQKPEKKYIDMNALCRKTLDLLAYQLRVNNITVVTQLAEGLPKTMADQHQLQQVLVNLLTNAYQAMADYRGEGKLTVATAYDEDKIYIRVTDNGPGIPPQSLRRIFDPFYTTKEKGTGLGLSLSYGIVQEHGGEIGVVSQLGQGTTFTVALPIIAEPVPEQEAPSLSTPTSLPAQKILVVDDEETILDLVTDILHTLGHQVETASSGREALQKMDSQQYDLIICDIKMPEVDGRQIYQFLKDKHPSLLNRLIFSSGDTASEESQEFLKETGCLFLQKPYLLEEFTQVLHQACLRTEEEVQQP